jgi:hypothetical protein
MIYAIFFSHKNQQQWLFFTCPPPHSDLNGIFRMGPKKILQFWKNYSSNREHIDVHFSKNQLIVAAVWHEKVNFQFLKFPPFINVHCRHRKIVFQAVIRLYNALLILTIF